MLAHHLDGSDKSTQTAGLFAPTALRRIQFLFSTLLTPSVHYRLLVLSRFSAAVLGGYLLCASLTAFLPLILPLKRTDAVLLTLSLSVLFYAMSFIAVFYFRPLKHIWSCLIGSSLLLIGLSVLLQDTL